MTSIQVLAYVLIVAGFFGCNWVMFHIGVEVGKRDGFRR